VADALDAAAVRRWSRESVDALGAAREEIDALNVYPVPDGDTGTNLFLTMEAALEAVDAAADEGPGGDPGPVMRALAQGAFLGARGNSGVILSQLLRGVADVLAGRAPVTGSILGAALVRAAELGYAAVAAPVEGTILTVARAAADAGSAAGDHLPTVVRTAAQAAREALARTPEQLETLRSAGVVDAGGRGLCVLLDTLAEVATGVRSVSSERRTPLPVPALPVGGCSGGGPAYEVMYLLDAPDHTIPVLRRRLAELGDSLVVVGGDGLWNVHVHVDEVGAAIEAGIAAGRPHRIAVTHFADAAVLAAGAREQPAERATVSVAAGDGLATLFASAGATVVRARGGGRPSTAEVLEGIRRARAREVVVLPNDGVVVAVAEAAAEQARSMGMRVAVVPTRSPVQAIAALAVHEPGRRFDDDLVAMTAAAGATRYGEVVVAARDAATMAGMCRAGDVLGLVEGEVVTIEPDAERAVVGVLERMLAAGGEMVTFVRGDGTDAALHEGAVEHLRRRHPEVETVVYDGGQPHRPLLLGVE
jgi:uncharacterized protein